MATVHYGATDEALKSLVGKKLKSVSLMDTRSEFHVETEDGAKLKFAVSGDCCSQSWIEHLELPDDYIGATVLAIRTDGNEDRVTEEDRQKADHLQVYQTILATNRGEITLEYRNDSNGFYGGSLDLIY